MERTFPAMNSTIGRRLGAYPAIAAILALAGCAGFPPPTERPAASSPAPSRAPSGRPTATAGLARVELRGEIPVLVGDAIDARALTGRIVFDDFEDVFTMNADGSELTTVAGLPGAEFDGVWSPDGTSIAYRDSRRGVNEDDEIFVVDADGSNPRNITNDPANDWGPDWSPDGEWIVFNSDRDGATLAGYRVRPDGSDLQRIDVDAWLEYPSYSPDGSSLVFAGPTGSAYDVFVAEIASGETARLTDTGGADGWPVWSPDGATIAFTTERDDCLRAPADQDCWQTGDPGEHHDIWLMNADGSNQRRVTPEFGQFVAWSPDGEYLLISGYTLYVVRPDGTGRRELRPSGLPYPPGGIPDWTST